MTSYTKKLYSISPAEAVRLHRQEMRDYRYGKHVTLATFHPASHSLTPSGAHGAPAFGKRTTPPTLPAYECWAPELGKPRAIVRASDSFQARKEYARHHQIAVVECAARRHEAKSIQRALERDHANQRNPEGWQEVDGVALPTINWAHR